MNKKLLLLLLSEFYTLIGGLYPNILTVYNQEIDKEMLVENC